MGLGEVNVVGRELMDLFNEWELRICVLLSLFLQILLISAGPFRRIVSRKWLHILLWSAYVLADGIAIFAVGLITSEQINYFNHCLNARSNNMLPTFWAPFLLAHLGGPDPITAFALEDNELWLRHLFALFAQCIAVAYVFYQSLTGNNLWVPSLLMFLCGIIKYGERTYALYCASANTFRDSVLGEPDPGANYANFMGEYASIRASNIPFRFEMVPEPDRLFKEVKRKEPAHDLTPLEVVQYAFRYFTGFKGLVVDQNFDFRQRNQSRHFFLARTSEDAFRVVEAELNFLYDVLFTKLPAVHHRVGLCCRAVSVGAIVTSLVVFHYVDKKNLKPKGLEIGITYTLLIGGIVLEAIAVFMFVFSDWTVVKLNPSPDHEIPDERSLKRKFTAFVLRANVTRRKIICWLLNIGGVRGSEIVVPLSKPTDHRRWAESISTFNLIYYCLHNRPRSRERFYDQFGFRAFLDELLYVERQPLPSYMKDFIFEELRMKSDIADDLHTTSSICSGKGDWVLRFEGYGGFDLFSYAAHATYYDERLLLWHIATELCHNDKDDMRSRAEQDHPPDSALEHHREIAKLISDYMIYLLLMKPDLMSAVSGVGLIRFRDTCAEAKRFLDSEPSPRDKKRQTEKLQEIACERIISVNTEVESVDIKGGRSKSVLFEAVRLAKELKKDEFKMKKWEILSKVWVELLSYGASHIRSNAHAQQLSKGGELITVVWLLMTQLGLGDQFQLCKDFTRLKLVVGK